MNLFLLGMALFSMSAYLHSVETTVNDMSSHPARFIRFDRPTRMTSVWQRALWVGRPPNKSKKMVLY